MGENFNPFANLVCTHRPVPLETRKIQVQINPESVMDQWAEALFNELLMISSDLVDRLQLTSEDLKNYCRFLVEQRVLSVQGKCKLWPKLKPLYIPATIQTVLTTIGDVDLYDQGLYFVPVINETSGMTIEAATQVSFKLSRFKDVIIMSDKAMPKDHKGDPHVMQMAEFAGQVRARFTDQDDVAAYIAAFLDLKLIESEVYEVMYRISYDTVDYITQLLVSDRNMLSVRDVPTVHAV